MGWSGRWFGETETSRLVAFVALCLVFSAVGALGTARAHPLTKPRAAEQLASVQLPQRATGCVELARCGEQAMCCGSSASVDPRHADDGVSLLRP